MNAEVSGYRIAAIALDEHSLIKLNPVIEQECNIAIADILECNRFRPKSLPPGPYRVLLRLAEHRLIFEIVAQTAAPAGQEHRIGLSLLPLRRLVKDYFLVCESYRQAIRAAPPAQLEAMDMGRRALHDEGSTLLQKRLTGKIETDFDTARRLFTLICVLHMKA